MSKHDSIDAIGGVGRGNSSKHADMYKQMQANRDKFAAQKGQEPKTEN